LSGLAAILAALLLGGGVHARLRGACPTLSWSVGVPLWGTLGCALWLGSAAFVGAAWSAGLVIAMGIAGGVLLAPGVGRAPLRRPRLWAVAALALALPQSLRLAANPAFAWDFRYIWGLKARVFAAAGGYDWAWLAWPGHGFAHPDYPPLWPDLLAAPVLSGGDVRIAAALWQGLLALALAAACWWAARDAAPPLRTLAAAVGAWSPVIFAPHYSGNAEPMLAFAAVVALASLRDLARNEPGSVLPLTASVAALALTKNEGVALAVGVVAGAIVTARGRGLITAAGLIPGFVWRAATGLHGIFGEPLNLAPAALAHRFTALATSLADTLHAPAFALLAAVWILALAGLMAREARCVLIALAVWFVATIAMYTAGGHNLHWWLATSLDRVLAAPLPGVLAVVIGVSRARDPVEAEPATILPAS
jgi:hypothetical protein